jgi:biopolymer transport protein ExbB
MPEVPAAAVAASTGSTIEHQLLDLFLYLGSAWILYVLLGLSVISFALAIERLVHFITNRDDLERLHEEVNDHLAKVEIDAAKQILARGRSHAARISLRGLEAIDRGAATVEEIVSGATALEKLRMERGLVFLGTLGNNAPFIGLFGTVLGIIRSFRDLSISTLEGSEAVMAGIAEALVATAVGLLVALPAVAVFNAFQRTIKSRLAASQALTHELLAHAKAERR